VWWGVGQKKNENAKGGGDEKENELRKREKKNHSFRGTGGGDWRSPVWGAREGRGERSSRPLESEEGVVGRTWGGGVCGCGWNGDPRYPGGKRGEEAKTPRGGDPRHKNQRTNRKKKPDATAKKSAR